MRLQGIGFEVGQQEKKFGAGARQGGVGPLLVRRDAPPVAVEGVVAVVALPAGREMGKQLVNFGRQQAGQGQKLRRPLAQGHVIHPQKYGPASRGNITNFAASALL